MSDKIEVLGKSIRCRISLTADDWQLFTATYPAECARFAEELNRRIEQLALQGAATREFFALLKPGCDLGATDSEPRQVMHEVLEQLGLGFPRD